MSDHDPILSSLRSSIGDGVDNTDIVTSPNNGPNPKPVGDVSSPLRPARNIMPVAWSIGSVACLLLGAYCSRKARIATNQIGDTSHDRSDNVGPM